MEKGWKSGERREEGRREGKREKGSGDGKGHGKVDSMDKESRDNVPFQNKYIVA